MGFGTANLRSAFAYDPNNPADVYNANKNNSQKLANTKSALDGVGADLSRVQAQVSNLEQVEIPAARAAFDTASNNYKNAQEKADKIRRRYEAATDDKKRIEQQISESSEQFDASKAAMASLAREEMRGAEETQGLQMMMTAGDSADFVDELETNSAAARTQARLLNNAALVKAGALTKDARLQIVNDLIAGLKKQAEENEAAAKQAQADAEVWQAKAEEMEAELVVQKAALEQKQKSLEADKAQAEATQRQLMEDMSKLANQGDQFDGSGGFFSWPIGPAHRTISAPFGYDPSHPYFANHTGTDFPAPTGTPIYAAADGTVVLAGIPAGYGGALVVRINHGNSGGVSYATQYLHLSAFATSAGAWVSRGQVIGYVGSTGYSTGPHLHFEVWRNGVPVNPMGYL
jgi:murein DD-endopeptidase MepM/ murein hydrolase activator NlpD